MCALNCRPMQLASCFIPRTNSLKCVVQLCRNGFFLCDIRVRAFIRFLSFFFLFLFHFSSPPPPPPPPHATSVPGQIVKRNLDVCGRFFFPGREKHQVPIFETSKSSIESMFKARCRRTNDRVISDRWRCAIRQLYIRSCSASNPIFLPRSERAKK